jgi:hypothetical protein
MRGRFTPDATTEEWCERRLLSRIHHYTLKRLRAEIEPVAAREFLRFLFDWQHVSAAARMAGPKALDRVAAQLEGFEAPAAAWESEILPSRSLAMNRDGSTSAVSLAKSFGCACDPATAGRMAAEGRHRCGPRRSRYYPDATRACGRRQTRAMLPQLRARERSCLSTVLRNTAPRFSTN